MLISSLFLSMTVLANAPEAHESVDAVQEAASLEFTLQAAASYDQLFALAIVDEPEDVSESDSDPLRETSHRRIQRFGAKDTGHWYLHGSWGTDIKGDDNDQGLFGVGLGYFLADDVSLNAELNGMIFQQAGDDTAGINFNLLLRWHFIQERNWSLYLDGGAGILFTGEDVPIDGSAFNFTPQAGIGMTYNIVDDMRLMAGVRWHHISNANTYDSNPGRDSIIFYGGLMFPF